MAMEYPTSNPVSPRGGDTKQQMPPKFSRYRSVRKAAASQQAHAHEHPPPPPPPPAATNPNIARSMSRYRRNKPAAPSSSSSQPPLPPLPPIQTFPRSNEVIEEGSEGGYSKRSAGRNGKSSRDADYQGHTTNAPHDPPMEARILDLAISSPTKPNGTFKEYSSGGEQCGFYSDEETAEERPRERKLRGGNRSRENMSRAANAFKGMRSGNAQKEAAGDSIPEIPQNHHREDERRQVGGQSSPAEKHVLSQFSKPVSLKERLTLGSRAGRGDREHLKKMISSPTLVDPVEEAGNGAVENAPVVDPTARKAHIQYNGFSISMPIIATTTPKDVLQYATQHLSDDVDPNTSFLTESFSQLELERPIRMYEHVQDILNSWDSDGQNYLVVSLTRDGGPDSIQSGGAPVERPEESSFHLYHSSRPGKWSKRWVTLRADGQVVASKKLGVEQSNICHLSDYDIYTPTPYQISKKLKPPKKICFAMKSQQKSNLFLNTENFVHYFCSNDPSTIDALYKAMQEWRSWYLGYTLGKIPTENKPVPRPERSRSSKTSTPRTSFQQRSSLSGESASNHPTNFRPLVDRSQNAHNSSDFGSRRNSQRSSSKEFNGGSSRRVSKRGRGPPPTSRNASRLSDEPDTTSLNNGGTYVKGVSPEEVEEATFAPTGLLGRTYSQRQKAQREREQAMAKDQDFDGPFSPTGLISNQGRNMAAAAGSSQAPTGGLPEGPLLPGGQQPLVDLTPVYKEPIHHQRKGRGVKVEPGKQLVDGATGREVLPGAIVIPSATTVNRPRQGTLLDSPPPTRDFASFNNNDNNNNNLSRSNTTRTTSRRRNPSQSQSQEQPDFSSHPLPTTRPSSPEGPFTPNGLLARSGTVSRSQGAAMGGRGIATGDRTGSGRPLVDLSEQSEFEQGSLLYRVEKWNDGNGGGGGGGGNGNANIPEPIIDRDRDNE
ncbi:hypothetical protein FQN54_009826 [Arachnomyces sp. PD_36]|nr:hypothetical protein FQN54_009826 [Arachnomyces sp. PD_36]